MAAGCLGLVVEEGLEAARSTATDQALLRGVQALPEPLVGVLRVCERRGDLVSLGRYHRAPPPRAGDVACTRRLSGGRVVADGAGFTGVALVLPHRAALVAAGPFALRPEQIPNRFVRGVLEGCKRLGVSAFYPGRDTITVDGRVLGMVSFEVDATGALLVEVILVRDAEAACLPARLEEVDPSGVVQAALVTPEMVTSLRVACGGAPSFGDVAHAIRCGYESSLAIECRPMTAPVGTSFDEAAWLQARVPRTDLEHRSRVPTQLGVLEVAVAIDDGRLREVQLCGDFIADSPAIAALEGALRGCRAEPGAIAAVVEAIFARPEHFILGIGPLRQLSAAIAQALPA